MSLQGYILEAIAEKMERDGCRAVDVKEENEMMPEKFMINEDSFGTMLPSNWREIADYLNSYLEELWDKECHDDFDDDFKETVEDVWERYCSDMIPDAPKAI